MSDNVDYQWEGFKKDLGNRDDSQQPIQNRAAIRLWTSASGFHAKITNLLIADCCNYMNNGRDASFAREYSGKTKLGQGLLACAAFNRAMNTFVVDVGS